MIKNWGPNWIQDRYQDYDVEDRLQEAKPLSRRKYQRIIAQAQDASESAAQASRRLTLEFAESMNIQRDLVYKERDRLIRLGRRLDGLIEKIAREVLPR